MLMPSSASASNMSAATPGCVCIPAPTSEILAMSASRRDTARADVARRAARARLFAPSQSALGTRERDVGVAAGETFCTIMSTLIADVGERAEDAGRDARPVGDALDRHLRLRRVVRDARDDRLLHRSRPPPTIQVPCASVKRSGRAGARRAGGRTRPTAACITFAPAAASSSISSYEIASSLRASGTMPRVGGEDAVDVGVDLADVGAERGGERDRGGVGAAAPERRDLAARRDALEAGDDHDRCRRRARSRMRGARISTILAPCVRGVGDDAGLRAGEARSPGARDRESPSRAARIEIRSPAESSMSSSRGSGVCARPRARERAARRSRRPWRETTTTTSSPSSPRRDDAASDGLDPLRVGDGRAAELLHDECHTETLAARALGGALAASARERASRRARVLPHLVRAAVQLDRDRLDAELAQPRVQTAEDRSASGRGAPDDDGGSLAAGEHVHIAVAAQRLEEVGALGGVRQSDANLARRGRPARSRQKFTE